MTYDKYKIKNDLLWGIYSIFFSQFELYNLE